MMSVFDFRSARRLRQSVERLERHGFDSAQRDALSRFLTQAADRELYRVNPRHWAERLGLDERTMLMLIVAGAAEGLFELTWQTICPICRYYERAADSLDGVTQLHHCAQCDHDFEAYLDEEIVVAVSINENLRRLSPTARVDPVFRELVNARYGQVPALALINLPTFRELLAHEVLAEGRSLGVKQLAVFFSDLRGSTAFYQRYGDARAYHWVCEHFKVLFDAAARHNGTAVKTIGDGVMGVFGDPLEALHAIGDALTGLGRLNARAGLKGDDALKLKVGLHAGPCLVVTLNGRLDYFGKTVNIAARLSELAEGNDVIVSHAILKDANACALFEDLGEVRPLTARLRGLPEDFELHRLIPTLITEGDPRP